MVVMDSSSKEMVSTEGAVLALLDFLVDPLLPSRSSSCLRETIIPSQEGLVAKQVHAVVLLYNYYHRKQHPGLSFLDFLSFCKLAVVLKPSLQLYFRLMQRTDYSELHDQHKHLSLTEKAIMNACNTSKSLDALNNQSFEAWPTSKVAVFLVDSRKENCYLFHSSITQGVWSVIEKEANIPSQGSEAVMEAKSANKKKRVVKRAPKESSADGTGLQQLAYLAVKETCGINQGDLKILEKHMVYSTSKEKTAVCLYIMQCIQTHQNVNLVPINDVMDSLQGPLVRKESISWIVTPVVEYFHLLPFVDKLSKWLIRDKSQNSPKHFETAKEDGNCIGFPLRTEQLSDSLLHFEAVKEVQNYAVSYLKEKPLLNISEENCNIFHVKEEQSLDISEQNCAISPIQEHPILNISESFQATEEVGSSCHLKEESIPYASKVSEALEARNVNSHLEEPLSYAPQHLAAVKEAPEAAGVRNRNSYNSKEKSFPFSTQPSETLENFQNIDSSQLNELCPYTSQDPETEKEVKIDSGFCGQEKPTEPVVYKKRNRSLKNSSSCIISEIKTNNAPSDYPRQEKQCRATASFNNIDINESFSNGSPIDEKSSIICFEDHVHDQKLMISSQETDQTALTGGAIVVAEVPATSSNGRDVEKTFSDNKISDPAMLDEDGKQDHALVSIDSNFEQLRKIQLTIASKENLISKTALKVLFRKREQRNQQLRDIADEMALVERNIQTILSGVEDDLAVKIDSIVEGCNEICVRNAGAAGDKTALQLVDQDLPPLMKRKRLSEANLFALSPCQELDGVCNENYWILPTYCLSASEGGFQAIVTVKGVDFECSSEGTVDTTPHEARNSAASNVLVKLRSMVAKS